MRKQSLDEFVAQNFERFPAYNVFASRDEYSPDEFCPTQFEQDYIENHDFIFNKNKKKERKYKR